MKSKVISGVLTTAVLMAVGLRAFSQSNQSSAAPSSETDADPDGNALRPTGSLSNRKPLRKTASPLRTHLPSKADSKQSAHWRGGALGAV